MVKILFCLLLCCTTALAQRRSHHGTTFPAAPPPGGGPSYLIDQNFEGAGYDHSEIWAESGSPVDEDYTVTPLRGSQSLHMPFTFDGFTWNGYSGKTTVWAFCDFQIVTNNSAGIGRDHFSIRATDTTVLAAFKLAFDGSVYLEANGSDSLASSVTLTAGVTYHVWLKFDSAGTCELAISSSTTKPTSDGGGNVYLTKTGASATAGRIYLRNWDGAMTWDHVLVDDVVIGNNP